jgi:PPP family 3-phenylpropionic acid transporter
MRLFPASVSLRLAAMHAANFSAFGFYMPFFPLWLDSVGMNETTIGMVLAVPMLVRILAAPAVSGLADGRLQPAVLLTLLNGLVMAGYFVLWPLRDVWLIVATILVLSFGLSGIIPVADGLTNGFASLGRGVSYGRVRVWGSVSFLAATLIGGFVLQAAGPSVVPLCLGLCAGLAALMAWLAPRLPMTFPEASEQVLPVAPTPASPSGRTRRAFLYLLAASACVQASHGALYAFGTLYWKAAGIGDVTIGALWAVGVAAEIGLFAFAGSIGGRGVAGLGWIMAGAGVAMLRFTIMAFWPGLGAALVLQVLHAATFGMTHLGAMIAISALAPGDQRSRAQGQLTAAHAIATSGATVLAGFFYARFGGLAFLAMVPVAAAGLACAVMAARLAREDGPTPDITA